MNNTNPQQLDLKPYGITVKTILRNLSPAQLYEEAIRREPGSSIAESGALVAYSGAKTGRSPQDKRIVKHPESEKDVWWGPVNFPLEEQGFHINRERAIDYLNTCERLYVVDAFAGWHPQHRLKIRIICSRPYHALFMHTMLIRPTREVLATFGEPDYVIFNAGRFPANRLTAGMTSKTSIDLSFEERQMVILGTEYAGEMKKGVFTIMNYLMPKRGLLSMHCSATADIHSESSSVLFGLSGTGKTTLSADPKRRLIGDDEHAWGDDGIFNIEGGCYAKAIDLTPESEPDIFHALRFGSVLENVVFDPVTRKCDFDNDSKTENTRSAYPMHFIPNASRTGRAGHPKNIIFLTADAYGVMPPIAKLDPNQAMYHFLSGYTAKVAGTEKGLVGVQPEFSTCFGAPFLPRHPTVYANLLRDYINKHKVDVWLVNSGWTGGKYGEGRRMPIKATRTLLTAALDGSLKETDFRTDPYFGFSVPTSVPGVEPHLLNPIKTWANKADFDKTARALVAMFQKNFTKFESHVTADIKAAAPEVRIAAE